MKQKQAQDSADQLVAFKDLSRTFTRLIWEKVCRIRFFESLQVLAWTWFLQAAATN